MKRLLPILSLVVIAVSPSAFADDVKVELKKVLNEIRLAREMLQSGEFELTGTYSEVNQLTDTTLSGKIEAKGFFDYSNDYVRLDRMFPLFTDQMLLARLKSLQSRNANVTMETVNTSIYTRTPHLSIHYSDLIRTLAIEPPNVLLPSVMPCAKGWFDPRALGMYTQDRLFASVDLNATLAALDAPNTLTGIEKQQDLLVITYIAENQRFQYFVDTKNAATVVKATVSYRYPELGDKEWRDPFSQRQIEWETVSGISVPVSYRDRYMEGILPVDMNDPRLKRPFPENIGVLLTTEYVFSLKWTSVNRGVDPGLFEYTKFPIKAGTVVVDDRSGSPAPVEVVGLKNNTMLRFQSPWTTTRIVVLVVNVVAILALLIFLYIKYRSKKLAQ
jgi:hypothetical protein